jgi:hypothetical protein
MPTGARPEVVFARRPVAEWAANARAWRVKTLLLIGLAIQNGGHFIDSPENIHSYYGAVGWHNRKLAVRRCQSSADPAYFAG